MGAWSFRPPIRVGSRTTLSVFELRGNSQYRKPRCSFLLTGLMQGTVSERDKSRGEVWQEAWWRIEEAKKLTVKVLSKCKGYCGVNTEPSPAHSLGYVRDQIGKADMIKRQGHYLSIYLSQVSMRRRSILRGDLLRGLDLPIDEGRRNWNTRRRRNWDENLWETRV